jgi:hypothetical protein
VHVLGRSQRLLGQVHPGVEAGEAVLEVHVAVGDPGDWIDYECLHDNGVTRPVRRDSFGNPTTLVFGVTTEDEMCTLNGEFYTQ